MIPLLRSALLRVSHGFSTRAGGVSPEPYAQLNLGRKVGDAPANVAENGRRFFEATGARALACLDQVHGDRVLELAEGRPDLSPLGEADAAITRTPGLALCIGTADCLPILIHAPDVGWVGAAHAGWRGAELRIGARVVEALVAKGASAAKMQAVLGPCIRRCCYEVSEELAQRFARAFGDAVVDRTHEKPHLDIALASRLALEQAGVLPSAIEDLGLCTACDSEQFFSHRRDRGQTGRMLAFIALP
ncbi:MAG: peptidoglycan editing factor PgeF [Deltaproteobacteria bacterium]|nr:peptidoglycan editing factor PgeF [Deltaproteobacteria bacterium]